MCPCANQPAENMTAPGLQTCLSLFSTKFCSFIRQLGVLSGISCLIDAFKRGLMLMVASQTTDYFGYIRFISTAKNATFYLKLGT